MIKLIAIDLDGTLLNEKKEISKENIVALKKAKAKGVKVVLCTGRPLVSVLNHLETLGLTDEGDYSATFNGGVIRKNDTGETLAKTVMHIDDIHHIYGMTSEIGVPLDVVADRNVYRVVPHPENRPSMYGKLNTVSVFEDKKLADFSAECDYNKMVCSGEEEFLNNKLKEIPKSYFEKYNIVRSGKNLFEFVNKEVTKGNGLKLLGEHLGIHKEEMMALGDEENDLSMIEYVGLGVVMENGSDIVKNAAQYITDTNDNHGVAKAVEKFVLN